jgi:hypothetical protein
MLMLLLRFVQAESLDGMDGDTSKTLFEFH